MFTPMTNRPFPVLCDRCRAEGVAGEAEFAELAGLGDLLDFEPVPRRKRANGWDAEAQRAFIAALAVTGSDRQAAAVVGRNAFGITQLCDAQGNEGFLAARAKAMEIFEEKERVRRSDGLLAAVHGEAARARGRHRLAWSDSATRQAPPLAADLDSALEPAGTDPGDSDGIMEELLQILVRKYVAKLEQERRARLEGRIAEADFYVRQITCFEVSLDMISGDGMAYLRDFRCQGHDLLHIAETEMSKLLDTARRLHWEQCGEPPRPEYPPLHLLVRREGFAVEPLDATWSDHPDGLTHDQQLALAKERNARDAESQIEWEAKARRDYEERRDSAASSSAQSRAEPDGPRPPGDGTDVTKPPS